MKAFEHANALSVNDAITLLGENRDAMAIAGGTDLLTRMKLGILRPVRLINLKTIGGLDGIDFNEKGGLHLGALATLASVASAEVVRRHYPSLVQAIEVAGSPQLRNFATIGGNLLQGSRCWYYRGRFNCWLKGGETCFARAGENRGHALFSRGTCYSIQPSDPATVLMGLDAELDIASATGSRRIPAWAFFQQPLEGARRLTALAPGEILTAVRVPAPATNRRSIFLKAMDRKVWSFALASVMAILQIQSGVVKQPNLVLGGVAPLPWLIPEAAAALRGQRLTDSSIARAAEIGLAGAVPLAHNGYKVALAKGLITRALQALK